MLRDYEQILKDKGYKITNQRNWVLKVLETSNNSHMTAEEIYQNIKVNHPAIGLATVYRTIQLLLDLKIIDTLNLNDGVIRYELANIDQIHHHHHLICEVCKKVVEVEEDLLEIVEENCERKYNFTINNHVVKFYGICCECKDKNNCN